MPTAYGAEFRQGVIDVAVLADTSDQGIARRLLRSALSFLSH
ncbi:UNVERIFIED_CONTAM: ribosomal protein S18 acetylase RimI-like enzyme [Jeotgalibacillus campisalis]